MLKKTFSILGLIILIPIGLVGLLLLIMGMVEGMISMFICGIIITSLSILGCIYCGKGVPKVNKTQSRYISTKQKGNISNCVICNNSRYNSSKGVWRLCLPQLYRAFIQTRFFCFQIRQL